MFINPFQQQINLVLSIAYSVEMKNKRFKWLGRKHSCLNTLVSVSDD